MQIFIDYAINHITITRGPLGHVLDAGIKCFGEIRVPIKWSSPVQEMSLEIFMIV